MLNIIKLFHFFPIFNILHFGVNTSFVILTQKKEAQALYPLPVFHVAESLAVDRLGYLTST